MLEITKICKLYIDEVIRPLLPKVLPGSWSSTGDSISLQLHNFELFKNSKFESPNTYDFIHFTSISNLVSIIHTKSILLSDLNLFEDQSEFRLANESLDDFWDNPRYYKIKSQLFAFSYCPYSEENINSTKMWNSYGKEGKGVCIHFTIDRDLLYHNFFFGKIQYHPDIPIQELLLLRKRHEKFIMNYGRLINNFPEALCILSSFYKKDSFKDENEIRLLKFIPKPSEDSHFFNSDGEIILSFNEEKNEINYRYKLNLEDKSYGNIEINSIYLKEKITDPCISQIYQYINFIFSQKFQRSLDLQFLSE